jgi:pyrophosphatase PpaX
MSTQPLTTFLFDLDGTLLDSTELILASYRHTLRIHRGEVPPDEVWIEGLGTPLRVQVRRFTDDLAEIDAMVATYRDYNLAHHDAMVSAFPGIAEAVGRLKDRGMKLGIVTSKNRSSTIRGLACGGMEDCFEVLVTADDVDSPKPDPQPVVLALRQLDAEASEAVFVGDSPHDLAAGKAAGVATAAVLWSPFSRAQLAIHRPDHWIEDPAQLIAIASAWPP